jgi:hypothetical protein
MAALTACATLYLEQEVQAEGLVRNIGSFARFLEVDFVVYGPDGFGAIEVKHTRVVRPGDLRGLQGFVHDYPARPVPLSRGGKLSGWSTAWKS